MFKTLSMDLGEDTKSDIGHQVIFALLFLFIFLAIFLSDAVPVKDNLYAMPIVTLTLTFLVILTLLLIPKGYAIYRWVPLFGLLILPPMVMVAYHQTGILFLMALAVLITPILFNFMTGICLALIETCLILLLSKYIPLSLDQIVYSILGLWFILGISILVLRIIYETLEQLNKKYRENTVLLNEAREKQGLLNELVKERTDANIQLARLNQLANHLRQIAEDERKIKEEFVAKVSHELRTPLNMIIGFCTILIESHGERLKRLPKSIVEDLEVILRNSQQLSRLINDILDLSQINAGQMAIVKEEIDLEELIAEAISSVQPLYDSRNLYLQTDIQSPLPEIYCDRTRIIEVLLNLLSNAGRYTQQGGVTIQASKRDQAVEIKVIDTGIGIPKQKQKRLFDPFYQVDGSIRRKYGGTGLGLSISKNIVELHNGRMWVESEEGKGTTIIFQLPLDESATNPKSAMRWFNPHQADYQSPSHPLGMEEKIMPRIVTVDPDGDLTRMLRRYMGQVEYIPMGDLAQGIEEVNQTPARLLLINTDQISNDMEQLRSIVSLPFSIPAILCSIPTSQRIKAQWDIFDILVKPISQKALVASIEKLNPKVTNVLVVDDDPDTRRMLKRMLNQKNREIVVLTASNGIHALQVMKRHVVDAILLDLIMPKMDGYQFLEVKKEMPEYKDVPVILISAHMIEERPVVSDGLGIVIRGGLTIQQLIHCLSDLSAILGA
jgi:signal transduction histidine kinase/CheY-like chemotaxis protein